MDALPGLRQDLRSLYERAFAARQHEVAYHVLAALLHAGEKLADVELLAEVDALAQRHLAWLDANEPRHTHSSTSADSRGSPSIFAQLSATAAAARARVKAEALQRRQEQRRRPRAPSS